MSTENQPEAVSEDQKVIKFVLASNKLEHAGSELGLRFVSLLGDHIKQHKINTVKGVRELLEEFSQTCDSAELPHLFSETVAFRRQAIDRVLTSSTSLFPSTMQTLNALSDEIIKELEQAPGAPKAQA